jgi:hypothetical protein
VVKMMRWILPLAVTSFTVATLVSPSIPQHDMVGSLYSQAPTQSALKSNRYTQIEPSQLPVTENPFASIEGYTFRDSFNGYSFYDKSSDASFRIVEDTTGYIWASSVDYDYFKDPDSPLADEGDYGLSLFWQNKLRSPFFLTYYQGINLREEHAFENVRSKLTMTRVNNPNEVGFDVSIELFLSKISFSFSVRFNDQGLLIELPFDSITEEETFKLSTISLYPMLGATKRLRTPGYVVVPDGVGALMRFNDDPDMGIYSKRFFGSDLGLNAMTSDQPLFANMYGLVHGHQQHAMLAIIEEGAPMGILNHLGSQVFLDFNFTYVTFNYRTTYLQYLNQAKTSSINLAQKDANNIDLRLQYQFLKGNSATYVGIANQFADSIFINDPAQLNYEDVPLHVDVLGLESKPGLFNREKVVMTDLQTLESIITSLQDSTTYHLKIQYLGWQEGGYSLTAPKFNQLDRALGSNLQLEALLTSLENSQTTLGFAADPYRAYRAGSGYQSSDIIQSIGQEFVYQGDYYYLNHTKGAAVVNALRDYLDGRGIGSIAFESIGHQVSSNFAQSMTSKAMMISSIAEQILPTDAVYKAHSYAWNAHTLLDMPMYSSEQGRFTDTVPLIPYIITKHRDAFGRAGNFFSNTTNELLRMIDYGLYPSFFITEESAYQFINTPSEHIFTSRYSDWEVEIKRQYDFIADALTFVRNQRVISRDVLALGVIKVTYENGVQIYINYTGNTYQQGAIAVEAMNFFVEEGV